MPIPLIYAGVVLGGMIATSVTSGYVIEKTIGDGDYSATDAAFDVGIGAMGGAVVGPSLKIGGRMAVGLARYGGKARKFGKHSDEAAETIITAVGKSGKDYQKLGIAYVGETSKTMVVGHNSGSSGGRSEQNASKVPSGGTKAQTVPPSVRGQRLKTLMKEIGYGKVARDVCPKGYKLVRTKTGFICQLK